MKYYKKLAAGCNISFFCYRNIIIGILFVQLLTSCEDFLDIDPPKNELISKSVFQDETTANATILGIYGDIRKSPGFGSGSVGSLTYVCSFSSDDLDYYSTTEFNSPRLEFYQNTLTPQNSIITNNLWKQPYDFIFKANSILESLDGSPNISEELKTQLEGEAKFLRAFSHFYLVNLFGDVPLITTTNYEVNSLVSRTAKEDVYEQIIEDLEDAKKLLLDNYSVSEGERIRPNRGASAALLARVYLFIGEWEKAETEASFVIEDSKYLLETDLNNVFLANSSEAIWQLIPPTSGNTWEGTVFSITSLTALTTTLYNAFEQGDNRKQSWVATNSSGVHYPFKYKLRHNATPKGHEYSMVLRLAEQYLIRAEARIRLGHIADAKSDLNIIRNRAGLDNTNANDQAALLIAIERERRVELFTEWGHRWLDLKRMGRIDEVLGIKTGWVATDALFPIPQIQIDNNPNMRDSQNPGY